ncbi:ComF family protein [Aminivibrio sp.]
MSIPETLLAFAGHLLWPAACPLCGALGVPVCLECLLPLLNPPLPEDLGPVKLWTGGRHEGLLREFALEMKYGGNRPLALVMGRALGRIFPPPEADCLVPVPLHRGSTRIYNQSAALASGIAREWNLPVIDGLLWREERSTQTALPEEQRRNMPSDALAPRRGRIAGKRAVLVDDVATTGTTLRRAASALERGGGRTVLAMTWTHSPKASP